jgi:SAM-dependent methyltransferase
LVETGSITVGHALDLCCGAGTNTVYLAQRGFDVVGIDISATALKIAQSQAAQARVVIGFFRESFVDLSFADGVFDFVFDMGCFHHVKVEDRNRFILGIHRVLKPRGQYMLTCFSDRNGPSWNHFSRQQIIDLFSGFFKLESLQHAPSLEGDGVIRFFYTAVMSRTGIAR